MALYFLRGSLPWQGLRASNEQTRNELILKQKQQTGVEELCGGTPVEFATYMRYLRQLQDLNRPDYAYLRRLFDDLFRRLGLDHDHVFDWTIREFDRTSGGNCIAT